MMDQPSKHQETNHRQNRVLNHPRLRSGSLAWVLIGVLILIFFSPYLFPGITIESLGAYASLSAVPVAIAAWLRAQKGALLACFLIVLGLALTHVHEMGLFWSLSAFQAWLLGDAGLVIFALAAGSFRSLSNRLTRTLAELSEAHKQLQRAEQQRARAYKQRLEALQAEQKMATALEDQRQLNQLKDQFLVNVSHELRTPLSEVYGYIELLNDHHGHLDTAMHETLLNHAKDGCQELMFLVNQVLDATQTSSEVNPPQIEAYSVVQVVREVLEHLDPRNKQDYQFHLDIPECLTVWADQHHMRQILRNLLSNAFKYAPKHTVITIRATGDKASSAHVCIEMKDEGPGIPPDEKPLLFGKFVRLKRDLSGNVRGTGLGLYICKQLVEGMKGHMWVESSGVAGEGSQFCFTLPSASSLDSLAEERHRAQGDPEHSLSLETDVLFASLS